MKVEVFIYYYGAVCLSMIVFNVAYAILLRKRDPKLQRRIRAFQNQIEAQMYLIRHQRPASKRHFVVLNRKLLHIQNLIAYEQALHPFVQEDNAVAEQYLTLLQPTLLQLSMAYQKRNQNQIAYFSYFLSLYMIKKQMPVQTIQEVLLGYMKQENLYCRVNALEALCAFGNPEYIHNAMKLQDRGTTLLHTKILTETLLSFSGDHKYLMELLWSDLRSFSEHTQLAILNYIRFQSGDYTEEMYGLMQDEHAGKEQRLAAIRYFGKYPYEPALAQLLAFADDNDPARWEYATVSISSLICYHGPQVIDVLKRALHSSNWYVRYAAAGSLEAQHVDYSNLRDIMSGNDRYAREMLTYRLESGKAQKAGV